jgi:hypothetical protein
LVKNINNVVFGEKLMNKISSIFVIPIPNPLVERLVKIHSERIEGWNFTINFEVSLIYFIYQIFFVSSQILI